MAPTRLRIDIKRRDNPKALVTESFVSQQSATKVARSDHCHGPIRVSSQNLAHRLDQVIAAITNAGMAKMTEIGQILTHLRIAKAE